MVLVAFSHGLRVSELTDLKWEQVDKGARLHVRRLEKGTSPCIRSRATCCAVAYSLLSVWDLSSPARHYVRITMPRRDATYGFGVLEPERT